MALGGGNFTFENKILDGSYINFVAGASASPTLGDRGTVAVPMALSWGPLGDATGEIIEVTKTDAQANSLQQLGMRFTETGMRPIREMLKYARKIFVYRVGSGGTAASGVLGRARYLGVLGNRIRIVTSRDPDAPVGEDRFIVSTRVVDNTAGELEADVQIVFPAQWIQRQNPTLLA